MSKEENEGAFPIFFEQSSSTKKAELASRLFVLTRFSGLSIILIKSKGRWKISIDF